LLLIRRLFNVVILQGIVILGGVVLFYMLLFFFGIVNGMACTSQAVAFEFQYKIYLSSRSGKGLSIPILVRRDRENSESTPIFVRKAILVFRTDEEFGIREIRNRELGNVETQRTWLHISNVS
jgi:hypothetical protein